MKLLIGLLGGVAVALGGLWVLQGLAIIQVRPILCVADCAIIHGRSTVWTVVGFLMLTAGALAVSYALRRRSD